MTPAEARAELWRRGNLDWKRRKAQQEIIDAFRTTEGDMFMAVTGRQFGKTWTACTLALELAMVAPVRIFYGTYSLKTTRAVVRRTIAELLEDCPRELRPTFNSMESEYTSPSGASITLAGLDEGRADDYRGRKAHIVIVDEAGFISDLEYVVKSVLYPMLKTTGGKLILLTTPPPSPGHDAVGIFNRLESIGAATRKTIYDEGLSEAEIERQAEAVGGKLTTHWLREKMAAFVIDLEKAVLPEFDDACQQAVVREPEIPEHFYPIVGMDLGFEDYTVALFGYYDFRAAKLVIQDEVAMRRANTQELAAAIKAKETESWGAAKVYRRVADNDLQIIHDLATLHTLNFSPTRKDDKEAQVNELRIWLQNRRLIIHPRCRTLIRHMKGATWNKARTTYERSSEDGHYDGVDALVYLLRNAPTTTNPYPALPPGVTHATHFIPPQGPNVSANAKALGSLFKRRG